MTFLDVLRSIWQADAKLLDEYYSLKSAKDSRFSKFDLKSTARKMVTSLSSLLDCLKAKEKAYVLEKFKKTKKIILGENKFSIKIKVVEHTLKQCQYLARRK